MVWPSGLGCCLHPAFIWNCYPSSPEFNLSTSYSCKYSTGLAISTIAQCNTNFIVIIPPNSNMFSDWRRMCHMPVVKTQWRPRVNKTKWRLRATTPWTFDLHKIRSCTLKPRQIWEPAIEVVQHFSLEKPAFIIQAKGFITAKIYQINKGENLNILSPSF